jgi:hypothetical protein
MHALATRLWNVIRIQRNLGELKRTLEQGDQVISPWIPDPADLDERRGRWPVPLPRATGPCWEPAWRVPLEQLHAM